MSLPSSESNNSNSYHAKKRPLDDLTESATKRQVISNTDGILPLQNPNPSYPPPSDHMPVNTMLNQSYPPPDPFMYMYPGINPTQPTSSHLHSLQPSPYPTHSAHHSSHMDPSMMHVDPSSYYPLSSSLYDPMMNPGVMPSHLASHGKHGDHFNMGVNSNMYHYYPPPLPLPPKTSSTKSSKNDRKINIPNTNFVFLIGNVNGRISDSLVQVAFGKCHHEGKCSSGCQKFKSNSNNLTTCLLCGHDEGFHEQLYRESSVTDDLDMTVFSGGGGYISPKHGAAIEPSQANHYLQHKRTTGSAVKKRRDRSKDRNESPQSKLRRTTEKFLSTLTLRDLSEKCRIKGVSPHGSKGKLVSRLINAGYVHEKRAREGYNTLYSGTSSYNSTFPASSSYPPSTYPNLPSDQPASALPSLDSNMYGYYYPSYSSSLSNSYLSMYPMNADSDHTIGPTPDPDPSLFNRDVNKLVPMPPRDDDPIASSRIMNGLSTNPPNLPVSDNSLWNASTIIPSSVSPLPPSSSPSQGNTNITLPTSLPTSLPSANSDSVSSLTNSDKSHKTPNKLTGETTSHLMTSTTSHPDQLKRMSSILTQPHNEQQQQMILQRHLQLQNQLNQEKPLSNQNPLSTSIQDPSSDKNDV